MKDLDKALRDLELKARSLKQSTTRLQRRNARRRLLGALRSLRYTVDRDYPPLEKVTAPIAACPKPPRPPKPQPVKFPRPLGHTFTIALGKLFLDLSCACLEIPVPRLRYDSGVKPAPLDDRQCEKRCGSSPMAYSTILLHHDWTSPRNWMALIHRLAHNLALLVADDIVPRHAEVHHLWEQFWVGPLPCPDLELAAEHQAFLEIWRPRVADAAPESDLSGGSLFPPPEGAPDGNR